MKQYRIGEFAARAGVTVRTVRYYDRLGLLKPSSYSESGQRLYDELDFARLGQILTLKLIGLPLDEIKGLLTTDAFAIGDLLERQKRALREKTAQLTAVIETIERAQRVMRGETIDLDSFIEIIKVIEMNAQTDWLNQFYTDEQQAALAARTVSQPFTQQKLMGEAWQQLFTDIAEQLDKDVNNPNVDVLIARWDALVSAATGGDPALAATFTEAYANLGGILSDESSTEVQDWINNVATAASFIGRARAARDTDKA